MAQKHLHELLQEDQEPFELKNYIADKCGQFKKSSPQTQIQVQKRKPISQNSKFPSNFCKNACFLSFHDSPDPKKSPLFELSSPAKSPCTNHHQNAIFLNVPARTASILLEAAVRIQKQSTKPKNQSKNNRLLGFFLKKLTKENKRKEISGDGANLPVIPSPIWTGHRSSFQKSRKSTSSVKEKSANEISVSCSGRPSSAVCSEKSLDLNLCTSSSSQSEDFDELKNGKYFCESPFHFVLQKSPSSGPSGHQTPVFSSPATSPTRRKRQNYDHDAAESVTKLQVEEEEEEEKEQCSPVSVLDPQFEYDEERHVENEDEDEEDCDHGSYDRECSYAIVQRAKLQLLQKLRRFEKLAELDPVELEKRILEQDDDDSYDANSSCDHQREEDYFDHESTTSDIEANVDVLVREVIRASFQNQRRVPEGMKRLVSDLIAEEESEVSSSIDGEGVVKRVCQRLESWREVESNTIDMMVGEDFRNSDHVNGRRRPSYPEEVKEMAVEVERAIFESLVEELVDLTEV